jgi:hypothetical protein
MSQNSIYYHYKNNVLNVDMNADAIGDAIDVEHNAVAVANDGKNTSMADNPGTD